MSNAEWMKKAHAEGRFKDVYKKLRKARPLCACGCGQQVRRKYNKWVGGHWMSAKAGSVRDYMVEWRSKKTEYSKEERKKLSEATKKRWERMRETGEAKKFLQRNRMEAGMLDHRSAKDYRMRDPQGVTWDIHNLTEWTRRHLHLFTDTAPASKSPFWVRVRAGLGHCYHGRLLSYKGWTAVSGYEQGRDLLNRK